MAESPALNDTDRQIQRLLRGLQQRSLLDPGDVARSALETNLHAQLAALSEALERSAVAPRDAAPPRRVAVAMALALHSQPHLAVTFGPEIRDGTTELEERGPFRPERPFVVPGDALELALGISQWELDDLREEVDRRAGAALKQRRALTWIWNHFGLPASRPAPLFRVLFPAQDRVASSAQLIRRSGRMYALVEVERPSPLPALHLGWMQPGDEDGALAPLGSFRAQYVDRGLRRALARGIGAEPWEIDGILDQMVVLVSNQSARSFVERDQWRIGGFSSLTGVGDDYLGAASLTAPVEREELEWTRWLGVTDGRVEVRRAPRALFDEFALARAQAMMKQLYAGLLSRIEEMNEDRGFEPEDLDLFDVARHLRVVLTPLIEWARAPSTIAQVAAQLRIEPDAATAALEPLAREWSSHLEARWLAPPTKGRRHTIAALLLAHLVALRRSLIRMAQREPVQLYEHRSIGLLFAAHYLAEAPIERLWLKGLSDMMADPEASLPPPEDIVGCWFWSVWRRVLALSDGDAPPAETPEFG